MTKQDLLKLIEADLWMMKVIGIVRDLNLPDCWVAAGFVRNKVWDHLHGYTKRTELTDVDVIYFDGHNIDEKWDKQMQVVLQSTYQDIPWSVKNQARMHIHNSEAPYASSADAMARWPETATAIGIRMNSTGKLELLAPYEIDDLVNLRVRMSPKFTRDKSIYRDRLAKKNWLQKWPKLNIEY